MSPRQRISSSRRSVSPSRRAHVVSSNRRSRSPSRRHDESRAHKSHGQRKVLPFQARELTKHDLKPYRDMFALYLDVQKSIDITVLEESEVKGRWKSFVRKWNEVSVTCCLFVMICGSCISLRLWDVFLMRFHGSDVICPISGVQLFCSANLTTRRLPLYHS